MKTASIVLALSLAATALVLLPAASAKPDLGFCTGPDPSCPYMFCYHPHYNEYGRVAWCEIEMYYPCQYCVPPQWDLSPRTPVLP